MELKVPLGGAASPAPDDSGEECALGIFNVDGVGRAQICQKTLADQRVRDNFGRIGPRPVAD